MASKKKVTKVNWRKRALYAEAIQRNKDGCVTEALDRCDELYKHNLEIQEQNTILNEHISQDQDLIALQREHLVKLRAIERAAKVFGEKFLWMDANPDHNKTTIFGTDYLRKNTEYTQVRILARSLVSSISMNQPDTHVDDGRSGYSLDSTGQVGS